MRYIKEKLDGVFTIIPNVYEDKRGYFFESFNPVEFNEEVCDFNVIQENESRSKHKVLRGLHYQLPPYNQAKLIRVINGMIIDVIVDIRTDSPTYGEHMTIIISTYDYFGIKPVQLFVPRGFAHGFVAFSKNVKFQYKVDNLYSPKHEAGLIYNDPDLDIDWEIRNPILSDKDIKLPRIKDVNHFTKAEWEKNPNKL